MNQVYKKGVYLLTLLGLVCPALGEKVTLEQVIKEVCTSSDSVKMMKESINKSELMVKEQYANAMPKANATISAGAKFPNFQQQLRDTTAFATVFNITQPIYTFGKIGTGIKVAKEYLSSAREGYNRSLQQLQLNALDAYFQVVTAELNLQLKKRSLTRKQDLHEFLDRNFKLGSGSKAQVLSALADVKSTQPEIIKAEQSLTTAKMTLNMLTGRPLNDSIEIDTSSVFTFLSNFTPPSMDVSLKAAYDNRSDLKILDHLANANLGGAKIFKSNYYPTIAANATFGTAGGQIKDYVDFESKRNWNIGIAVQWQFFDGFANQAKYKQYLSDARKLQLTSQVVKKNIEIEIEGASLEYAAADSNLVATKEQLAALKESYDLTNETFKQGSGQYTDLQLAEERLSQTEVGIVNAQYRVIRSRAALVVAMGKQIITMEEK